MAFLDPLNQPNQGTDLVYRVRKSLRKLLGESLTYKLWLTKKRSRQGLYLARLCVQVIWVRCRYRKQMVLSCLADLSSIGGNELQFRLVSTGLIERQLARVIVTMGLIAPDNQCIARLQEAGLVHIALGDLFDVHWTHSEHLSMWLAIMLRILNVPILQVFNPPGTRLIPAAKRAGMRVIYWETGLPLSTEPHWDVIKPYLSVMDSVISVSNQAVHNLKAGFGYQGAATVIPSMIEAPPQDCCARMPVMEQCEIVYFGRLCEIKQLEHLIHAFVMVRRTFPFVRLTFIGEGPVRESLQTLARDCQVDEYVTWHNWLQGEALYRVLTRMDLFCLPSRSEGSPCSIAEAMSIGLAVIASPVGGIPETVINGQTGLLIEPNDVPSLARAISKLIEHPELRAKLALQGRQHYQHRQTLPYIFTQLLDVYQRTLV